MPQDTLVAESSLDALKAQNCEAADYHNYPPWSFQPGFVEVMDKTYSQPSTREGCIGLRDG